MFKRQKPDDLRDACVCEAMTIIGEHGLEALSLRDVARRLGVSHQAPYKHFASRDHILAEIVRRAYADFAAAIDRYVQSENALEELEDLGRIYLDYARIHPLQYKLMFGTALPDPEHHPGMMREARHAFTVLRSVIARLPGNRTENQIDLDALYAWSAVHGLASILQTRAGEQVGFSADVIGLSGGHLLTRVGETLSGPAIKNSKCLPS